MPTPIPTLRASLERHNDAFESLLKLIPAQYYIVNDASEEQVRFSSISLAKFNLKNILGGFKISKAQQETKTFETRV